MSAAPTDSQRAGTMTFPAAVHTVPLTGPAGRLEALLNEGQPKARCAVLLSHPHPLFGGTMHNKVVYRAMKLFNDPAFGFGFPVLRFNFRGVGLSEGVYDGRAEADDVRSALDWLAKEYSLPVIAAGFSFGAAMTLAACTPPATAPEALRALVCLGLPIEAEGRQYDYPDLGACTLPKLFLSGDQDAFAPAARLAEVTAKAAEPKQLTWIANADHFFTGRLEAMQEALSGWLLEHLS